jgi:hypothetical protein
MHSKAQSFNSQFRAISLVVIAALIMAVALLPAWAQNSVPPTAVQAAKMPEFASRLARAAKSQAASRSSVLARAKEYFRPLQANDIYDNGPINGTIDAWTINFGFITSDSFTVTQGDGTSITGMSFGAWLIEGDTLQSVQVSITSGENGGTSYFNQTVNFTQSDCSANQYVYDVCLETSSAFSGLALDNGTYWVNLQNAVTADGEPVYWDENSGPSSASQNDVGTIPSESFTILGSTTTTTTTSTVPTYSDIACPAPQTGFHDLHDFSPNAGPSGLAIDTAGKLYGTLANGGSYGAGLLYDFAQRAGHWFLTSLYSFLGGSNGSSPNGVIVGPEGAIFGSAAGGFQTCGYGSSSCGLIYEASPATNVCTTALCSWNETTIYQFTGNTDAWGGTVTAFDSAGNLYGIGNGGAYGAGAVFELTPSSGGWTEQILYSFSGSNGSVPNSLLMGHDGNLYGTAGGGGVYGYGAVFQLVLSAGGWTENVLYNFTGLSDGYGPGGLIQDSQGTLYGFSICYTPEQNYCGIPLDLVERGLIFAMSPSGSGWSFNVIYNAYNEEGFSEDCVFMSNLPSILIRGLTLDAAGNLYDAEGGSLGFCLPQECQELSCGQIVNVSSGEILVTGTSDIFENITSDANGNLYGTTSTCGFESPLRTSGMIWQYSP